MKWSKVGQVSHGITTALSDRTRTGHKFKDGDWSLHNENDILHKWSLFLLSMRDQDTCKRLKEAGL